MHVIIASSGVSSLIIVLLWFVILISFHDDIMAFRGKEEEKGGKEGVDTCGGRDGKVQVGWEGRTASRV